MKGGERDEELADDVVGVTSARLAAAGVPAARRRSALRLLSVLESVAGPDRRVRRDLASVAVEFGLPPHEVEAWLDDLLWAGAVEWHDDELVLQALEPPAPGALRLHDFLALAQEMDDEEVAPVVPLRRAARPAMGILVAAALLVVALVGAANLPDRNERAVTASGISRSTTTTAAAGAADTTVTTGRRGGAATPTTAAATAAPGDRQTTTTTVPPTCPADPPVLEVLRSVPDADGRLDVQGVARNSQAVAARVRTVVVQGVPIPVDITVPAGGSVPWSGSVDLLPVPPVVSAGLGDWEWVPPLPQGCAG